MQAAPTKKNLQGGQWLNVILLVAFLCLCLCGAALYFYQSHHIVQTVPLTPREENLLPIQKRPRLDGTFASTLRLKEDIPEGAFLFFRLRGQTDALECRFGNGEVRLATLLATSVVPLKSASLPADARQLIILKSPGCIEIFSNGVRLLATTLKRQEWRSLEWLSTDPAPVSKNDLSYQKIGSLFFSDNFMHGEGEMGEWKGVSGEWSVHALKTPVRSANPFSFMGKGEKALAMTGFWFWRNYRLSCAVQMLENSGFALRINCLDEAPDTKCDELRWELASKTLTLHGQSGDATHPLNLQPGKWYHVTLSCINGLLSASIDGISLLTQSTSSPLLGGKIGLVANGAVIFDDVLVEQTDNSLFHSPDAPLPAETIDTKGTRRIAFYNLDMSDSELSADLTLTPGSQAHLSLREATPGALQLTVAKAIDGQQTMKLEMPSGATSKSLAEIKEMQDEMLKLTLRAVGRDAFVICNGKTVAVSRLPQSWSGGASIELDWPAEGQPPALTSSPRFQAASPLPEISTHIATFSSERSMSNWNDPVREWLPSPNGKEFWHRSDFWSDVALSMNTSQLGDLAEYGLELGTTTTPQLPNTPFASISYNKETQKLTFTSGDTTASINVKPAACRSLGLERRADRILARLNGNLAWNVSADGIGPLILAGRIGKGATKSWAEAVSIRADGVHIDIFDKAPTDWIAAAGNWEVTNRWQCDPRWSFFSGVNPDGPACLWSKYTHGKNITMEYFMGPKMDRSRGNNEDKYAADHNLVIAADGQDIASGYSIMLGGWNNRGTQLVRQKEILAENKNAIIDKSGIHHRWYHVKVRKQGGNITVWLDGKLAANVTDPLPLAGNRFALWTWKNGIMVAQHRFSTDNAALVKEIDLPCKNTPITPYD